MKRMMHSYETKMQAVELKLKGYSNRQVKEELGLKNKSQVQTWWTWYRNGEMYRFNQPVGKQYSYGKGLEGFTPEETMKLRIKSLEQQIELLKKVQRDGKEVVPKIIVNLVNEFKGIILVKDILSLFNIAKSTYYRWKKKNNNMVNVLRDNEKLVIKLCKENHFRYGYRKITALINKTKKINKNTVQRIMQKFNCQCRVKIKKNKKYTHQPVIFENKINRAFKASRPLEKLATDITYLPFGTSMQYLSSIIDLYNGEIIAQTISDKQDLECVKDTLNQLPKMKKPCILHSDQGSVYTSKEYQLLVKNKSITMSMSRKGTPADNAPIESFHSTLKSETFYLKPELKSSNFIVSQTVLDYIKYYNEVRIQEKLGYVSPLQFRRAHTT